MTSESRFHNDLTAERVRELFHYDPETGIMTWRFDRGTGKRINVYAGDRAGSISNGYILIKINGTNYKAHRLAWLWMIGKWPAEEIDHINLVRDDNRFCNLREATSSENKINSPAARERLLPRGVCITPNGKFRAQIANTSIGTFDSTEEAAHAYALAAHALYGEFYRPAPRYSPRDTPAIATAATVETTPRLWRRL